MPSSIVVVLRTTFRRPFDGVNIMVEDGYIGRCGWSSKCSGSIAHGAAS
jgi:hypothetical protein